MRPSSKRPIRHRTLTLLRKELGMNQTDFSEIADCSTATIQSIETGRLDLSPALAARITIATGISTEWLRNNDPSKPMVDRAGDPYSKEYYDSYQAALASTDRLPYAEAMTPGQFFGHYETMRRVVGAMENFEKLQLARYRLNQFFAGFIKEFTGRPAVATPSFDADTFKLVEQDLKSAKRFMAMQKKARFATSAQEREIAAELRRHLEEIEVSRSCPE